MQVIFLTNREAITVQMEKDATTLLTRCEENYASNIGPSTMESISSRMKTFLDLLKKPRSDMEGLFVRLIEAFKKTAPFVLNVSFYIRDDCDEPFKAQLARRVEEILAKQPEEPAK